MPDFQEYIHHFIIKYNVCCAVCFSFLGEVDSHYWIKEVLLQICWFFSVMYFQLHKTVFQHLLRLPYIFPSVC